MVIGYTFGMSTPNDIERALDLAAKIRDERAAIRAEQARLMARDAQLKAREEEFARMLRGEPSPPAVPPPAVAPVDAPTQKKVAFTLPGWLTKPEFPAQPKRRRETGAGSKPGSLPSRVLAAVRKFGPDVQWDAAQVGRALNEEIANSVMHSALARLRKAGYIEKTSWGMYRVAQKAGSPTAEGEMTIAR